MEVNRASLVGRITTIIFAGILLMMIVKGTRGDEQKRSKIPISMARPPPLPQPTDDLIYGGTLGTNYQLPFLVSVAVGQALCGGSVVADGSWIVTAAHCFRDFNGTTDEVWVQAGTNDISTESTGQIVHSQWWTIHPLFTLASMQHDVAMIKLKTALVMDGVNIAPIPLASSLPVDGTTVYTAGWGYTQSGNFPASYYWVNLPFYQGATCSSSWFGSVINPTVEVCAGGVIGKDACSGDSGGPLFLTSNPLNPTDAVLVGVTSWGYGCGTKYPGVYTNLPAFGAAWIQEQIALNAPPTEPAAVVEEDQLTEPSTSSSSFQIPSSSSPSSVPSSSRSSIPSSSHSSVPSSSHSSLPSSSASNFKSTSKSISLARSNSKSREQSRSGSQTQTLIVTPGTSRNALCGNGKIDVGEDCDEGAIPKGEWRQSCCNPFSCVFLANNTKCDEYPTNEWQGSCLLKYKRCDVSGSCVSRLKPAGSSCVISSSFASGSCSSTGACS